MKKAHIVLTLFLMALGFSCTDEATYPVDFDLINNSNAGILKIIGQNSVVLTTDIPGSKFEVTLEANDRDRGKLFSHVDLFVSFQDLTPGNGGTNRAEALLKTYQASEFADDPITDLPRVTMIHTATEIMTLLGITLPEVVQGKDQLSFRQAMVFPDGKTYSSGNVGGPIAATGGVYKSPFANIVPINVCPSDLGGDVDYLTVVTASGLPGPFPITPCLPSVSGTTTFTSIGHGQWAIGDSTFGQYECVWSDTDADGTVWNDFCDQISVSGSDKYGLVYTFALVSNDGTTLVVDWSNDYGDAGTSSLTRAGGWPLGLIFL